MTGRRTWGGALRRGVIVALLLAIVTGVGDRPGTEPEDAPLLDILIAVDVTASMSAQDDEAGSRLAAAHRDLARLVAALPSARYTLVSFGSQVEVELRATSDPVAIRDEIDQLDVEPPAPGEGTRTDRALPVLQDLLAGPDGAGGVLGAGADMRRILVFVSDGEQTADTDRRSFSVLARDLHASLVLGYGTTEGGLMPDPNRDERTAGAGLVMDPATERPAVSRFDGPDLRRIAEETEGAFEHRVGPGGINELAEAVQLQAYDTTESPEDRRQLAWMWSLLLLGLLLIELRVVWSAFLADLRVIRP